MTRFAVLLVFATFSIAVFTQMIINKDNGALPETEIQEEYKFPKKVQAVIDKSCYGCHSENGKSGYETKRDN